MDRCPEVFASLTVRALVVGLGAEVGLPSLDHLQRRQADEPRGYGTVDAPGVIRARRT